LAALLATWAFLSPTHAFQTNAPEPMVKTGAKAEVVAQGLVHPWGMRFLPDGRMLVTERPGRVRLVSPDGAVSDPLQGAPVAEARGQGGMLDIELAPDFTDSRWVFFSFTEKRAASGKNGTSVARARLDLMPGNEKFEDAEIIFRQQPAFAGGHHFGSRLVFAQDGSLFITLGERNRKEQAQDPKTHLGVIARINRDGSVPGDNPFVDGRKGAPEVWSFGHRNPQAAALQPGTGRLWIVEHGAQGGDEINIPEAGKNYGWPVISYGQDYGGEKIGIGTRKEGMEQPIYYWDPSIAPSGMAFYTAERFPEWKGNLFVGALKYRSLYRLVIEGDAVVAEERLLRGVGQRIRDVRQGPDGAIYILTDSSNGRILRVTPGD
jgi:aldose sugar dehydrogenase